MGPCTLLRAKPNHSWLSRAVPTNLEKKNGRNCVENGLKSDFIPNAKIEVSVGGNFGMMEGRLILIDID